VVGTHRTEVGDGRLTLTLAYNYNENEVTRANPNVISRDQRVTIENLAPKHRANLSSNWSYQDWSINGRMNYYSTWINEIDYAGQTFSAETTLDLDVSYRLSDSYAISLGVNNLGDVRPDKIKQSATNDVFPLTGGLSNGTVYPRNGGPFGINGRFTYLRLAADF